MSNEHVAAARTAASTGDLITLKELFDKYPKSLKSRDASGVRPLHLAAENGHVDVVKYLIESNADAQVNKADDDARNVLHWACWKGHYDIVLYLLQNTGIRLDTPTRTGWTALHYAAFSGSIDTVKVLLEYGADDQALDESQQNPKAIAERFGKAAVVRYMREHEKKVEKGEHKVQKRQDIKADEYYNEGDDNEDDEKEKENADELAKETSQMEMQNLERLMETEEEVLKQDRGYGRTKGSGDKSKVKSTSITQSPMFPILSIVVALGLGVTIGLIVSNRRS